MSGAERSNAVYSGQPWSGRPLLDWQARLLLLTFLALAANHAVRPMVTYAALDLGASGATLGIVAGSFSLFSSVVAAPLGRLVDRIGEPIVLLLGTVVLTLSATLLATAGRIWAIVLAHALLGLGQVACLVGMQTMMANRGDPSRRVLRFGRLTVAASLGQMFGPATSGLAYGRGVALSRIFLLCAVPMALSILVAATLRPLWRAAAPPESGTLPRRPAFIASVRLLVTRRGVPESLLASLAVLASIDILIAYLPGWGAANGISPEEVGFLLGLRAAVGLLSRLLMMRMLRLMGTRTLLALSMAIPAVSLCVLPLTTAVLLLAIILSIAGFGLGLGQPLSLATITDLVPPEERGTALGLRITANRTAQLVMPALAGAVAGAASLGVVFVMAGAVLAAGTLSAVRTPSGAGDGTGQGSSD